MIRLFQLLLLIPLGFLFACDEVDWVEPVATCNNPNPTFTYDKAAEVQAILDKYTALGVPGVSMGLKTATQEWAGASGYARIEGKVPMQICHLQYAQSLAKTYTGVLVMMLYEEGKIQLDNSIKDYLPVDIAKNLKGIDEVTVRMLLNHTSGIFDYAYDYAYATDLLSNQNKTFNYHHFLDYVYGKDLQFTPGSKYDYSNTNYVLLALIVNQITGQDHSVMMTERIFKPLNLNHTYYHNEPNYLHYSELVNCYLNRRSDHKIENVTRAQVNNVKSMIGDDGLVATPQDYVHFLEALRQGKILKKETLALMTAWVNDSKGEPAYGLGLDYTVKNNTYGYGHSGSGLGAGCLLYYFPEKDITVFVGVNLGLLIEGPFTELVDEMQKEIFAVVLK
ncbi:beta-lactamase family protein [Adhaeribacter swui]|uniref:Beta-lactamase family protein n=1 Tax=Adhaeribacter swui TaxID=2086471 RepID=A0A7G7GEB9_9BACT|nr:serine hydrolase domain-containing protein [Adhaeribacter swui]QNF35503.1 beta-lactamase family protein [Adhaeribacter swui]